MYIQSPEHSLCRCSNKDKFSIIQVTNFCSFFPICHLSFDDLVACVDRIICPSKKAQVRGRYVSWWYFRFTVMDFLQDITYDIWKLQMCLPFGNLSPIGKFKLQNCYSKCTEGTLISSFSPGYVSTLHNFSDSCPFTVHLKIIQIVTNSPQWSLIVIRLTQWFVMS